MMAQIEVADGHIPDLMRLSREYNVELVRLVNLMIAIGIETLEAVEFVDDVDEPIPYELGEESSPTLPPTITVDNAVYIQCRLPYEEET
jgi:hypothetical protein